MSTVSAIIALYPSRAKAAKAFGVTGEALRKWELANEFPPGRCHQAVLLAATNGLVTTVHDLRPDFFGPAPGVPPVTAAPADTTANAQAA